jgi:hypothetical protein
MGLLQDECEGYEPQRLSKWFASRIDARHTLRTNMNTTTQITYNFYSDPGHGWLNVKLDELKELGIADKISGYSYQRGNDVYLEEDCDMSTFMNAMEAKGVQVKLAFINERENDSFIRSLRRYG